MNKGGKRKRLDKRVLYENKPSGMDMREFELRFNDDSEGMMNGDG